MDKQLATWVLIVADSREREIAPTDGEMDGRDRKIAPTGRDFEQIPDEVEVRNLVV